ncbi:MAG: DUF2306 domain-containing protein, partial [Fulvivirga sp.]
VMKKVIWIIFAILSTLIGLYPTIYFIFDKRFGLLGSKTEALLNDNLYNGTFYTHIVIGGFTLLIGWLQFSKKLRRTNMNLHRLVGKGYVFAVLVSGLSGLYIALFATGGLVTMIGFLSSGIVWLSTTMLGFNAIKKGDINKHKKLMIYSYAVCFSAVTLRIWLPMVIATGDFLTAYNIVAWLSWVPNVIFAYFLTFKRKSDKTRSETILLLRMLGFLAVMIYVSVA